MTISRRDMLKATAAAAAASLPLNACAGPESRVPNPKFFTAEEFALVDELSDMIIPTDAQSGGARAAGVAAYLDGRFSEAFEKDEPERFRAGIKAIETLSRQMHGTTLMAATAEQRLALLTQIASAESDPKTDAEKFFRQIKGATIGAYYTSKIGIHDDQQYKGNVVQTGEYAGSDPS